jgi:PTS system ascorbate-specific IIA component
MSVGLLLITHNRIGSELLATATATFGGCPTAARTLSVGSEADPDQLLADARRQLHEIDSGSGVLVLTDCFGSTPSNIANRLLDEGSVRIVSGVSLPMLIRVMNYARLALGELADKAVSGGCEGVVLSGPSREQARGRELDKNT